MTIIKCQWLWISFKGKSLGKRKTASKIKGKFYGSISRHFIRWMENCNFNNDFVFEQRISHIVKFTLQQSMIRSVALWLSATWKINWIHSMKTMFPHLALFLERCSDHWEIYSCVALFFELYWTQSAIEKQTKSTSDSIHICVAHMEKDILFFGRFICEAWGMNDVADGMGEKRT